MESIHLPSTPYRVTDIGGAGGVDFILDFPSGKDITILQLTDVQLQTMAGVRTELRKRQVGGAFFSSLPDDFAFRAWRYMDEAVERTRPDLIVLTGDNIYGELDDSGAMWQAFIQKMDSYCIPWCVVFGNHDNESGKGVTWQVEKLLESQYCIFRQGTVTGNCNYNVLLRQGNTAKYLLYLLDSNGCKIKLRNEGEGMMPDNVDINKIEQADGFRDSQAAWMYESAKQAHATYGRVPALVFCHTPPQEAVLAAEKVYGERVNALPFIPDQNGDFGLSLEHLSGAPCGRFWDYAKEIGCTGIFLGHLHKNATSMLCDGIRMTFGLKSSTYDYHDKQLLGATLITLPADGSPLQIQYVHSALPYEKQ